MRMVCIGTVLRTDFYELSGCLMIYLDNLWFVLLCGRWKAGEASWQMTGKAETGKADMLKQ